MSNPNPPGTINITVGQRQPTVTAVSYGLRTLKGASDLNLVGATEGDVIVFKADTNSFVVEPIIDTHLTIDNGFF